MLPYCHRRWNTDIIYCLQSSEKQSYIVWISDLKWNQEDREGATDSYMRVKHEWLHVQCGQLLIQTEQWTVNNTDHKVAVMFD